MKINRRAYTICLLMIFLLAFVLRVGMTWRFVGLSTPPDFDAQPDQIDYEMFAYHLSIGKGYSIQDGQPTARRTPGTSLTLLPVYLILGRSYAAGRIWFCALSALTCLAVVFVAQQCFSKSVAILGGIMLAFYPGHFYYSMHFVSEGPYVLFMTLALGMVISSLKQPSARKDILAGIFWGAAILTRPQIIFMIPLTFLIVLLTYKSKRTYFHQWCIQVLVVILMLTPWVVRNAVVMGRPTLSTIAGHTLWGAHNELTFNNPDYRGKWIKTSILFQKQPFIGTEVERDQMAMRYAIISIKNNLDKLPSLLFAKLTLFFSPIYISENRMAKLAFAGGWLVVAPLTMIGIWVAWHQNPTTTIALLLPLIVTVATVLIFWGDTRFRHSVVTIFIIFSAVGVHQVSVWIINLMKLRQRGSEGKIQ